MCPRKDKTPYQWETVYDNLMAKQEPESNDYTLLTEELLKQAHNELKEDYKDAIGTQKRNIPTLQKKWKRLFILHKLKLLSIIINIFHRKVIKFMKINYY